MENPNSGNIFGHIIPDPPDKQVNPVVINRFVSSAQKMILSNRKPSSASTCPSDDLQLDRSGASTPGEESLFHVRKGAIDEILDTIAYLRFSVCGLGGRFTA